MSPSNDLRTVDNAGFVDNAGRTTEVTAGTTPAVRGRGEGLIAPRGREEPSGASTSSEVAPTAEGGTGSEVVNTPASSSDAVARLSRALCDREGACNHVGEGKRFGSADACMADKRTTVGKLLAEGCPSGIAASSLGGCLGAIRVASCDEGAVKVGSLPACRASAVCPR